jgi:hypothetical protein
MYPDKIDEWITKTASKVNILETIDIICFHPIYDGLRVRVFFNLKDEEKASINREDFYPDDLDALRGVLYFPTLEDFWDDDSIHIQYYSGLERLSKEDAEKHKTMLEIIGKIFDIAYHLLDSKSSNLEGDCNYPEGSYPQAGMKGWPSRAEVRA